jgi:hypothetical protein
VSDSARKAAQNEARGARLARARVRVMPSYVKNSSHLNFPREGIGEGIEGTVILSFVALPNGRVDRDSRTVLYYKGHPLFVKVACDFLLAARFDMPSADSATVLHSFGFRVYNGTPQEVMSAEFDQVRKQVARKVASMDTEEAGKWFALRPSCSSLQGALDRAP